MPVSARDERTVADLLIHDVSVTVGAGHEEEIRYHAANRREFVEDYDLYVELVVDDVQQYLHDCFIDTIWPQCPRHPNHPMWLQGRQWCCTRDQVPIARLGELMAEKPLQSINDGES